MAKLLASETAARVCDQAARVFASYGYAMEYPVQRYLRDVRFTLIGGGTSEILKLIIRRIAELRGITQTDGVVRIGALTTITELLNSALVRERFNALWQACDHF